MRMTHTRACLAILAITLLSISSAWALTPAEVLGKAEAKYKSLTSYSATGKTVSIIGAADANADKVPEQGFQEPHSLTHTFTIKLGRPDLYLIQWEQKVHPAYTQKGAVWSAGEGDFLLVGEDRYSKISKESFLIRQRQLVLGGSVPRPEMTDDTIKQSLKQLNKEATPEAVAEMRKRMEGMMAMAGKQKGTLTETHQNIVVNKPAEKAAYRHPVPAGLRPSASPF